MIFKEDFEKFAGKEPPCFKCKRTCSPMCDFVSDGTRYKLQQQTWEACEKVLEDKISEYVDDMNCPGCLHNINLEEVLRHTNNTRREDAAN